MPQIAGFRGLVWDTSRIELAKVATAPVRQSPVVIEPADAGANVASPGDETRSMIQRGELIRDATRAVYRYHQVFSAGPRTLVRKSWFAAIAVGPYDETMVRPHEATDPGMRAAEHASISSSGVQTEPVLVGYRDAAGEVDRLFRKAEDAPPNYEVTTPDGTTHKLWRCTSAELIGKLRPAMAPKKALILGGHAVYDAMIHYREQLTGADGLPMYSSANFGLACLVNLGDPALAVGARHRVVYAPDLTAQRVLDAAKRYFIVEQLVGAAQDVGKQFAALANTVAHQPAFIAVFPGDANAWKLTLSPDISPVAEGVAVPRAIQKYEPIVVEQLFLRQLVPDARTEIVDDPLAVFASVQGGAALGLVLRPLTIDQIAHVDDVGALLPAGSTAIYPPIANRLIGYCIDPNDDLV